MDILGFLLIPVFFIALLMAKKVTQSSFYAKLFELHLYCLFAAIICSTIIKALVGRQSPPHFHGSRGLDKMSGWVDNSTNFNFGFLNEQVFGGFPSSHATVYFALAFSIYYFLQTDISKKYIRTLSQNGKFLIQASSVCMFVLALSIGLGVSLGHHWFSEFVAGLVLGLVIAKVVREMKKNTVGL